MADPTDVSQIAEAWIEAVVIRADGTVEELGVICPAQVIESED